VIEGRDVVDNRSSVYSLPYPSFRPELSGHPWSAFIEENRPSGLVAILGLSVSGRKDRLGRAI